MPGNRSGGERTRLILDDYCQTDYLTVDRSGSTERGIEIYQQNCYYMSFCSHSNIKTADSKMALKFTVIYVTFPQ